MVQGLRTFTAMAAIAIMATMASHALGIADQIHGPGLPPEPSPSAQPATVSELSQPGGPLSDSGDGDAGPLGSTASNLPPRANTVDPSTGAADIQMRPLSADDITEADISALSTDSEAQIRTLGQQVLGSSADDMSPEDISEALDALAHANAAHANALAAADEGTLEAPEPIDVGTSTKLTPSGAVESPAYGGGDLAAAQDNITRLQAGKPPRGMANEGNTTSTSTDAADSGVGSSDDESSLSDAMDSAETAQQAGTTELSNAAQSSNAAADAIDADTEATTSATQAVQSATNELADGPSSIDTPSIDVPGEDTAAGVIEDGGIDPVDFA